MSVQRDFADFWNLMWEANLGLCAGFALLNAYAPDQDLPWKPLDLSHPVGQATMTKVADFEIAPGTVAEVSEAQTLACIQLLNDAGIQVERVPDKDDGGFCVARGLVRFKSGAVTPPSDRSIVMQCPLALRYVIWDRQVLRPSTRALYGQDPKQVDTMGSYACRRIYGSTDRNARPSEHAQANAVDVAGVTLRDGRKVSVLDDWDGSGPQGRTGRDLLNRIRDGGCRVFSTVLSPEYNEAHRNHLHLDGAARGLCA